MSSMDSRARDIIARQSYIHWATNLGASATFDDAPAEGRQLLLSEADAILTALADAGIQLAGENEVEPVRVVHVPSQAERIADLIAERDALAERVRLGDELKRALDSWLLTGDGWEDVGAARTAIAERDDDDL